MKQTLPIIFFGSDIFVLPILKKLHNHFTIPLVLTTEKLSTEPISTYANNNTLPLITVTKFTPQIIQEIQKIHAKAAVLAYFGLILPHEVLSLFPKGIINVHPSLLPKFRGPTPVQSAMLSGEVETGVSIIRLDDQVDHGPILVQETEPILDMDTDETLHKRLFEKGAYLLLDILPQYLSDKREPKEQDHTQATFTHRLTRQSGYFDSKHPPSPQKLQCMIRAYFPWPGVWTTTRIKNKEVRIKLLPEQTLQLEGKRPMSYKDFLNGYPEKKDFIEKIQ